MMRPSASSRGGPELLRLLLCEGEEHYTSEWAASWDAIERVAARPGSVDPSSPVLTEMRTAAMARVTDMRHESSSKRAFGANVQVRRQFIVQKLSRVKVGRAALPGPGKPPGAAQPERAPRSDGVEIHAPGIHLTRERTLGHVALPGSETSPEAAQPACRPSVFEDSVPQVATRK